MPDHGVLKEPPAKFHKLACEPQHLSPICPSADLARPFHDRHLKLDRTGNAHGSHQPVRFDIATMHSAKRRQDRDSASPGQVAEQVANIPSLGPVLSGDCSPTRSGGPDPAASGSSPSARHAAGGIPRPSANASNVELAVGTRLRVLYSLSLPCGMPVRTES